MALCVLLLGGRRTGTVRPLAYWRQREPCFRVCADIFSQPIGGGHAARNLPERRRASDSNALFAECPRQFRCILLEYTPYASVAQGIEHRSPKAGVDGSNPPGGTSKPTGYRCCHGSLFVLGVAGRAALGHLARHRLVCVPPYSTPRCLTFLKRRDLVLACAGALRAAPNTKGAVMWFCMPGRSYPFAPLEAPRIEAFIATTCREGADSTTRSCPALCVTPRKTDTPLSEKRFHMRQWS